VEIRASRPRGPGGPRCRRSHSATSFPDRSFVGPRPAGPGLEKRRRTTSGEAIARFGIALGAGFRASPPHEVARKIAGGHRGVAEARTATQGAGVPEPTGDGQPH